MTRIAQTSDDIRDMADEVARLMADRFGGARRGKLPGLEEMLRRRGGALPRNLRGQARVLAEAEMLTSQPRVARQMDLGRPSRAYNALMAYLQPLGSVSRWQNRAVNFGASIAFGLLVLAALVIWMMVRRGHL
ncbi:hypothetical protein MLD63_05235 [Paracoccus sp. TK19116]|uniref:DUF2937 family protein n=1 Tax=Paracoccus albicereus TaxID=2922394 RepID=A0ABT1MQN4_9RHOB|nr:hypothetical protein [Paracoccus albicereus]MCQ0969831.1 hypothetical protein [Paracoccus albicereus]